MRSTRIKAHGMATFQSIVVPVDFSAASELALQHAKRLAVAYGARICLIHVMEDTFLYASDVSQSYRDPFEAEARKKLRELLSDEEYRDLDVKIDLVSGKPFAAIIQYARSERCDLIVIATHGHGVAAHMILGSVAENVLRTAPCPVYVVRETNHDEVKI